MSKNTQLASLINYISVDGSGNVILSSGQIIATQNYVATAVSNLVASAPSTLDTLNELATALGNDANFATTVTNSIATKLPLSGGTLTGLLTAPSVTLQNYLTFTSIYGGYIMGYTGTAEVPLYYAASSHNWSTAGDNRMRLTTTGLGIGTINPERRIDIDGTGGNAAIRIRKASNNMIFLGTGSSSTAEGTENAILQMHHNGTEKIRLYTDGNSWITGGFLGIGTSSPTHLVSLYGTTQADIKFQNAGATRAYIWSNSSELAFNSLTSNPIKFFINDTEVVRFRADGFTQFGPNSNTLIYGAGNNGRIYMYQSGFPKIYIEADASVIFNNQNGVMINNETPVGKMHIAGALTISNNGQTFRRVLTTHGQAGTYTQVKVIFNKSNWGSVTYDIKLASAGGSYHTAGAYYSNPGFSSHVNSISAGNGASLTLTADSQTGSTQGAIWTFQAGNVFIHPSLTVDISCGNGYQVDPNDIVVQFI